MCRRRAVGGEGNKGQRETRFGGVSQSRVSSSECFCQIVVKSFLSSVVKESFPQNQSTQIKFTMITSRHHAALGERIKIFRCSPRKRRGYIAILGTACSWTQKMNRWMRALNIQPHISIFIYLSEHVSHQRHNHESSKKQRGLSSSDNIFTFCWQMSMSNPEKTKSGSVSSQRHIFKFIKPFFVVEILKFLTINICCCLFFFQILFRSRTILPEFWTGTCQ